MNRSVDNMFRQSFLAAVSAASVLPLVPDLHRQERRPPVPSVGSVTFWFQFYATVKRGSMSTEWAREKAVAEIDLQELTEDEAKEYLELASEGAYKREDLPAQWRSIFGQQES